MIQDIPKIDPYPEGYILEWFKDSPIPDGWELFNDESFVPDHEYYNCIYIQKKVNK